MIESTEIKISLTIRQGQSLAAILHRINTDVRKRQKPSCLRDLPVGMLDDSFLIEDELRNLLEFVAPNI